jgi:xanthosine utilization system XapX-like protein
MATTLPYSFDTSRVVKLIMRGFLSLLAVLLVGILYSLLVSHSNPAALQLTLSAAVLIYFGQIIRKHLTGVAGTITAEAVSVQPGMVWGMQLAGPAGIFRVGQFQAIRVERVTNPIGIPIETQIGPHERVTLIGQGGTPDILIARTSDDAGRTLGSELAAALRLPYQEQIEPY